MTEPPCIKKELPRKYIFNVCKCGHGDFKHKYHWKYMGFGGVEHDECEECLCNKYNELGKFTYDEWHSLPECKDEK